MRFDQRSVVVLGAFFVSTACVSAGDTKVSPDEKQKPDDDEGDSGPRRSTLVPTKPSDDCGGVIGECLGTELSRCIDGEIEVTDCATRGLSCAISEAGEADCLSCDEVSEEGYCTADIVSFCAEGTAVSVDCSAEGLTCAVLPAGFADCVDGDAPPTSGCGLTTNCPACCSDTFPDGETAFNDALQQCLCDTCGDVCGDACSDSSQGASDECVECSSECVVEQDCGAGSSCADYAACSSECSQGAAEEPDPCVEGPDGQRPLKGGDCAPLPSDVIPDAPDPSDEPEPPPADLPPAPNLGAAYRRLAQIQCELNERCFPFGARLYGGTVEACTEAFIDAWAWEVALPDSGITMGLVDECAQALATRSCETASLPTPAGPPCWYPGSRENDEPCAANTQCKSGWCGGSLFSCGVCQAYPVDGTTCADASQCPDGMRCIDSKCTTLGLPGEYCDDQAPCYGWANCVDGECKAWDRQEGETCGPELGLGFCASNGAGLDCDASGSTCGVLLCSANECVRVEETFAEVGEPCDQARCTHGAQCVEGMCVGAELGEACGDVDAPPCLFPGSCVQGVCTWVPSGYSCDDTAAPETDAGP